MSDNTPTAVETTSAAVNWTEIRARLEAAQTAASQNFAPSEQAKKETLKARAGLLARERNLNKTAEASLEIIEFRLANETYALEVGLVQEVQSTREITPLPCTPPFVVGIVNLRGQIFSVINLKKLFDLPDKTSGELDKIIFIHNQAMAFGLLADAIIGVRSIPVKDVQAIPPTLTGRQAEYVKGITSAPLIILDARQMLNDDRLIVREDVTA